ncbi:hypothetical protein GCM10028822_32600 [Hymenobacter terrigena]
MLSFLLTQAGFFSISWTPIEGTTPGLTYVRPSAKGIVRAFVPDGHQEVELYAGRAAAGQLRYRGPVGSDAELQRLLATVG